MSGKFSGLGLGVEAPGRFVICHPITGQPLRDADGAEAWIDLLSADSAAGRAHDRAAIDQQIRAGSRRMTAEQIDASLTEKLARLTKDWRLLDLEGNPLDVACTPANARELYGLAELSWLRAAALGFVSDLGNFRPAAAPS